MNSHKEKNQNSTERETLKTENAQKYRTKQTKPVRNARCHIHIEAKFVSV